MKDNVAPLPSVDSNAVQDWHAETDVLIVGGGGAGISAAIEAADAGASVTVLEAASEPGGSTAIAGGLIYMGGGTATQRACGFTDTIEDMYNYLMHGTTYHGRNYQNPLLSRLATTYYHRWGPVGAVTEKYNWLGGPQNTYYSDVRLPISMIGMGATPMALLPTGQLAEAYSEPPYATVGLGTGTMASYVRPYQHMAYYEIDDKIKHMSVPEDGTKPLFTYVDRANKRGGNVEIIMAIGREDSAAATNQQLSDALWNKNIWHALRWWDGWAHDWPWWRDMIRLYIGGHD